MAYLGRNLLSANTTDSAPTPPYYHKYWLACESLLVVLTIITIYLTVCLVKYAVKKETESRKQKVWQRSWLKWLSVASSALLLLRLISDHVAAFYGWRDDHSCLITVTISIVLFSGSLFSAYIFLWVRQSVFYSIPIMKKIMPKALTYISWFTLVFMLLTGVALGVMYNIPQITQYDYQATNDGCREVSVDSPEILPGVMVGCTILFQLTLLALFVYPLLSRETAKFRPSGENTAHGDSEKYNTSSLSRSDECKPQKEDDSVFHEAEKTSLPKSPPTKPPRTPISPLARENKEVSFDFGRNRNFSADTDNESGADNAWAKNRTIRRETPSSPHVECTQKRKSVFERFQSGSVFYRKAKSNSLSSENMGSPAASDSEQRLSLGSTLRRKMRAKSKRDNEKGRKLMTLMKKYAMLMFACVLTDLIAAGTQVAVVLPELVFLVIYDVNLLINLFCIVMTFENWKNILAPCFANIEEKSKTIATHKLKRKPTPQRKKGHRNRVETLRQEGLRGSPHSSRRSSASGYESGDSAVHTHIYRPAHEVKALLRS